MRQMVSAICVVILFVGYNKDRESALVQVTDTTYNDGIVEYHLGLILEKTV